MVNVVINENNNNPNLRSNNNNNNNGLTSILTSDWLKERRKINRKVGNEKIKMISLLVIFGFIDCYINNAITNMLFWKKIVWQKITWLLVWFVKGSIRFCCCLYIWIVIALDSLCFALFCFVLLCFALYIGHCVGVFHIKLEIKYGMKSNGKAKQ